MRRWCLGAACLLSAVLCASTASADDARTAEAEARFKEGVALADAGKHEAARLKFLQALEMKRVATILYNLASMEVRGGYTLDAIEHYRAFLKLAPTDVRITDTLVATAKARLEELLRNVGQIEVNAPPDAKVSVDGRALAELPADPIPIAPGKHLVKGALNGKTVSVEVSPEAGKVVVAKLDFGTDRPAERAVAPSPGTATFATDDGIGGERSTIGWIVPIGLGVLGVAGIVTGAAFASASNDSKAELDRQRSASPNPCAPPGGPACAAYEEQVSTVNRQGTIAWVGYGIGAVSLAASVATFLLLPKTTRRSTTASASSPTLVPMVGPREAGANLQLRF